MRELIRSAADHWHNYQRSLPDYDRKREAELAAASMVYEKRNQFELQGGVGPCRDYRRVLLTGSTGYLGSYLLRELLLDGERQVSTLVRGVDDATARFRLGETLRHYFGAEQGALLRDHPRLTVLAGDLRSDGLGLSVRDYDRLAESHPGGDS